MKQVDIKEIAKLCLHEERYYNVQLQSTEHRFAILSQFDILEGSRVLELGCGQGDCTAVLAEIVGPSGHVTAIDPGAPDYGAPFTLQQAQSHLSSGALGGRITWRRAMPTEFLQSDEGEYDVAVLVLCTWYFMSPRVLTETLSALVTRVKRVCIAEWDLSDGKAPTHVLAVLTQAALESRKSGSISNVRTLFTASTIRTLAAAAGLRLEKDSVLTTASNVSDGSWEVQAVIRDSFANEIEQYVEEEREKYMIKSMQDATLGSLKSVGGTKSVKSMDVWCGSFVET
ncbi:S-adenosyl-L-methionine-dependent methyltransferase [Dendrothele bispora CBS 962.96]|uniref:S-adenosyl-L-methionine-dependent methyltransferase n=1 Tax=Dendrothele bispora (strain CBS 962.96) TaxID=1314807 RepID=A0A4S8M8D3_DENBC|nr:S-adenosyl-L-methionine-dependent methyltransferase [Dendrothele bispora CBS 962.96]